MLFKSLCAISLLSSLNLSGNEVAWGTPSKKRPQEEAAKAKVSTQTSGDWGGISAFGEAGYRNFRGSATYGVYFSPVQRFKISGEYLTQELDFHFHSHHRTKWVSQYAIGGQYQYIFNNKRFNSLDLGTAYNQAFSNELKSGERIAGSYSALSFIGTTVSLWKCGFLALHLDYDWTKFVRKYEADKRVSGFGGTASFTQQLPKDLSFNVTGEFRPAFNSYQGLLNWSHQFSSCALNIGVFGNLTSGHKSVRTIQTGGVRVGLSFGPKPKSCGRSFDLPPANSKCHAREFCNITQWISTPAVYVPIVLVIADEKTATTSCTADLRVAGTPPPQFDAGLGAGGVPETTTYDVSVYFLGSGPITYSVSYDPAALPPGDTVSIDPTTGLLSLYNEGQQPQEPFFLTITASNECGSASFTSDVFWMTP